MSLKCLARGSTQPHVSYRGGIGGRDHNHRIPPFTLLYIWNINPDNISAIVQQNLYLFIQHIFFIEYLQWPGLVSGIG